MQRHSCLCITCSSYEEPTGTIFSRTDVILPHGHQHRTDRTFVLFELLGCFSEIFNWDTRTINARFPTKI